MAPDRRPSLRSPPRVDGEVPVGAAKSLAIEALHDREVVGVDEDDPGAVSRLSADGQKRLDPGQTQPYGDVQFGVQRTDLTVLSRWWHAN
jgi:hypothetical protein